MVVIETKIENKELLNEIAKSLVNTEFVESRSLDGNDIVQLVVPVVSIIAPLVAITIQKIFIDERVTIKYGNIELTAMTYEKAVKLLRELLQLEKKESDISNEHK
jgi:hypothetical protein